jgi:hypothetical protein
MPESISGKLLLAQSQQWLRRTMTGRHSSRLATALFGTIGDFFEIHVKREALLPRWRTRLAETKMKKAAFRIFGALLIVETAVQMPAASEHHMHSGRGHHRWDRPNSQLRETSFSSPQMRDGKPAVNETRSCDNVWCYPD